MKTYDIALMQQSKYVDNLYTYMSNEDYSIGDIVIVPFGISNKMIEGVIVRKGISDINSKTKKITAKLENMYPLSKEQIDTALFIREKYMCSYNEAIRLFISPSKYTTNSEKYTLQINLINEKALDEMLLSTRKNAKNKILILNKIKEHKIIDKELLEQMLNVSISSYIKDLEEKNIITTEKIKTFQKISVEKTKKSEIVLNDEQQKAYNIIKNHNEKPILLYGITGSGKTQVYIKFVKDILMQGKTAIILVPEISLTMQTINRFTAEFEEDIAIIHSNLTKRQRYEQWLKIKNNISKIVIGARSALFSPVKNLGTIIIDECHDDAYKSQMSPKYDTIELSQYIAKKYKAKLLLSTATPTIVQYYNAEKENYTLVKLTKRANNKPLPKVEIVNMLDDMKSGNEFDISRKLQLEIKKELAKENQVILFLNKRGYSNNLTCDNCGYVPKCENCDITLTYHSYTNKYKCHYCNFETIAYKTCPNCNDGNFMFMGSGTQKIENQIKSLFPNVEVFRMDKDTTMQKGVNEDILKKFANTPKSILIGTQMIGKGHDFPKVTLVGIINADQGINSPDYKALERTYNILEQVGGRAGRASDDGLIIIQTFSYNNNLLYYLKTHRYLEFYQDEIEKRELFRYEPFSNIIRLIISSVDEKSSYTSAYKLKDALNYYNEKKLNNELKIYEVSSCLITKIDKKYRYQIVIRVDNDVIDTAKKMINYTLTAKRKVVLQDDSVSVSVDVNPDNML